MPEVHVAGVRGEVAELLATLTFHRPDVVFNLCEAPLGRPGLEAHAAALLEWLKIPFTGARSGDAGPVSPERSRKRGALRSRDSHPEAGHIPLHRETRRRTPVPPRARSCVGMQRRKSSSSRCSGLERIGHRSRISAGSRICGRAVGAVLAGISFHRRDVFPKWPASEHLRRQMGRRERRLCRLAAFLSIGHRALAA